MSKILTDVLSLARSRQQGRVSGQITPVSFSEYWFRTSGLLYNIVTKVLDLARSHQFGRVTDDVTAVTFSERWFRTSGLYNLNRIVSHLHRFLYIRSSQPVSKRLGVSQLVKKKGVFVR